ncbi:MAG: ATP-binding protein [Candidatus Eisenbacteria bacterium]|nr:ATP-binding protein [Candidatus Eisenbacteria bacterium]
MEDLSLHILDVVENATAAGATLVEITIRRDQSRDLLEIIIADNGRGMDPEMAARVRDPFVTTRTTRRVGMGLPLLEQSAQEAGGTLALESQPGRGTRVHATFQDSHIDRRPLGDIAETMVTLLLGNPEVDFLFTADFGDEPTVIDTRELRAELGQTPLTAPDVLRLIRETIARGVASDAAADQEEDGGRNDG